MLIWWTLMIPSGFLALLAGWFVTEMGRQPYTVYGLLRTTKSLTPAILGSQVAWSLLSFVVMYTFIFGSGIYYITKLIRKGIVNDKELFYTYSINATTLKVKDASIFF
jgi:cytochrome d ubiquinol oxidase subunit I